MNDQRYISMYGGICDRLKLTRAEGMRIHLWLTENGNKFNKRTRDSLFETVAPFSFHAVESIEVDTDIGHIASLRAVLDWSNEGSETK